MFKILFFMLFQASAAFGPVPIAGSPAESNCPEVANVQKTGSTSNSLTYSWTGSDQATQYRLWYLHQESGYTSPGVTVTGTSHTFGNLYAGHYTLYFRAECSFGPSGFIGVEDIVSF